MISTEDSIIRLVISLILGAIIGYERSLKVSRRTPDPYAGMRRLLPVHDYFYQRRHGVFF